MTPERIQPEEKKPLTVFVSGGGTLFRAHCPELDITHYGQTQEEAKENLLGLAKAEIRGILKGKGDLPGKPDERKPLAETLVEIEDLSPHIELRHELGPQRAGLK